MADKSSLRGGPSDFGRKLVKTFQNSFARVQKVSEFKEKRTLTPEEFLKAGEYLVQAYPSWQWYGGTAKKRKDYLGGPDKQCLVLRHVPVKSPNNLSGIIKEQDEAVVDGELGDWVCPPDTSNLTSPEQLDEIPDLNEEEEEDSETVSLPVDANQRTYDLFVAYDKYYRVPTVWLVGYDAELNPLTAEKVCEDISKEHAGVTVTWDQHPHEDFPAAAIHPCRHAEIMKNLLDAMEADGNTVIVDHYLLVFLKFITALIPTIEFDYSVSI